MSVNIVITLFEIDKIAEVMRWIDENIKHHARTVGKHIEATRHHIHIAMYMCERPKPKDLSKYYRNTKNAKEITQDPKDIKFTIYEETDRSYNMKKCLAYPLKEYETYDAIEYKHYNKNITDDMLEKYRIYAHEIWSAAKYKKERAQIRKEENSERAEKIETYLQNKMTDFMTEEDDEVGCKIKPEYENDIEEVYYMMYEWIVDYHKYHTENLTWRWSDIPNQIYSFMARSEVWTTREIVKFRERRK